MKTLILGAAMLAATIPAFAQTNVSISVGQPGFYGRIDIGDWAPPPVLVQERPVIIEQRVHYRAAPLYLRVPPGHRKNWAKHCRRYEACGRPVYFVTDEWYTRSYAPRYMEVHRERDYHDRDRYERHEDRGHGHGHGNGHGKGHGRGHG